MPIYEANDCEAVLKRIRDKVDALGVQMGPCLSEAQIAAYEQQHQVQLPPAFRLFLQRIGNGCAHMLDGRRLFALEDCPCEELSKPFLLETFWLWEDDPRDEDIIWAEKLDKVYRGNLNLIDLGCCMSYNLIVTGPRQGEVWNFTDVGVQPCCEPQDFLGWFELWLDCQKETDYFKDFVYDEADDD